VPLGDLTDPEAVVKATQEFDEVGRDAFLERYGFGPSREYVLVLNGREYDSKAILGAAHGHQHPDLGPLAHTEFNGGEQTVSKLRQLGFNVQRRNGSDPTQEDSLPTLLRDFLDRYAEARSEPFRGDNEAARLLKRAADRIRTTLPSQLSQARVRPSVGQGNWAAVPWIAVLDPRVTTTTQEGVYPVVLIREDLMGLYVTIAQGVTNLKRELRQRGAYDALRKQAEDLRPHLGSLQRVGFSLEPTVDLGRSSLGRDYAASAIVSKYFARGDLAESSLEDDIAAVNDEYVRLLEEGAIGRSTEDDQAASEPQVLAVYVGERAKTNFESGGRRGWWGWKRAPGDADQIRVGDLIMFASGYTGGSPRVAESEWQKQRVRDLVIGRVDKTPFRTDEPVMPDELSGAATYPWKLRFTILGEEQNVSLTPGDSLNAGSAEALRLSAIAQGRGAVAPVAGSPLLERYLREPVPDQGTTAPGDVRALSDSFVELVGASGMKVDRDQLVAFLAGTLAKPFIILTGQSGSGKTQLAKRLGEWCGQDDGGDTRYLVVPVRPDWTGPEYLFGYPDGLAQRVDGRVVWAVPETLEFLLRAHRDPSSPYVLILDEMNLAHVERYFADFLSGIESGEPVIPNLLHVTGSWVELDEGGRLPLPSNLVVLGTVNVDETTYMFSPKVLDRAFTYEFRVLAEDLDPALRTLRALPEADANTRHHLVRLLQDKTWQFDHPHPEQDRLVDELRGLHQTLARVSLDFGHRVMFEALRFAALVYAAGISSSDEALDLIVMTKLLPKVHGSRQRLETMLRVLQVWAQGDDTSDEPRFPRTWAKLERMLAVLVDAQFVTFTE
jgi:MrcB-like, N-terminal domain